MFLGDPWEDFGEKKMEQKTDKKQLHFKLRKKKKIERPASTGSTNKGHAQGHVKWGEAFHYFSKLLTELCFHECSSAEERKINFPIHFFGCWQRCRRLQDECPGCE